MPSRPLSHDRQLEVLLGAMIQRAGHNANARSVQDDLDEILATADRRCDLLSEAVGLRTLGWDASSNVRQRELSEHFVRLDLPGIEEWFALARERAQQGNHTADGFAPRTVDLPGVGLFGPGELPGV